jgi:hypothetical protein
MVAIAGLPRTGQRRARINDIQGSCVLRAGSWAVGLSIAAHLNTATSQRENLLATTRLPVLASQY